MCHTRILNFQGTEADTSCRIAQVAYHTSSPLFTEDEFLIVIWAIVICTVAGPCVVGWTVKRWGRRILHGGWE